MIKPAYRLMLVLILGLALEGFLAINEASANIFGSTRCSIHIMARNDGPHPVNLSYHDSKVKIRGGLWKKVFKKKDNLRVLPGSEFRYNYLADVSCEKKRRWLFTLKDGEGCAFEYAWYKPSSTGWFARGTTVINLHDLSRKCNR